MLHGWDNFFVAAAQAGAALIGLLFVTVTISTGFSTASMIKGTRAFLTPTLGHFAGVLFISLAALAPWKSLWPPALLIGLLGLVGLAHQLIVLRTRREAKLIKMGWGEWIPYAVVPMLASVSVIAGAISLVEKNSLAPYFIAAGVAILLFAGISGAWDMTLWLARNRKGQ